MKAISKITYWGLKHENFRLGICEFLVKNLNSKKVTALFFSSRSHYLEEKKKGL